MMTQRMRHVAELLAKFGVRDAPTIAAIAVLAALQYVFLAKLWEGYPLKWSGDLIHPNVVITGIVVSLIGGAAIVFFSMRRWLAGDTAARRLERPATDCSFEGVHEALADIVRRTTLTQVPDVLYTPKNALALEVRQNGRAERGAIVVGLDQRKKQRADPESFAGQLGHELSHLEFGATLAEIVARRAVVLHFRALGWLVSVFALVLGFIDPRGIGSRPRFAGFEPVFAFQFYAGLLAQFTVLVLSSLIIIIFSYYFLVRREHVHDLRGSQLVASGVLADRVFSPLAATATARDALLDFLRLHPTARARALVIRNQDHILLSVVYFPLIVAGAQPLMLLLSSGWRPVLEVAEPFWNLGLTVASGLLLYLVLSADLTRLGMAGLLGRQAWIRIPTYAMCAALATQLPRIFLEIIFGLRNGFSAGLMFERVAWGVMTGGGRIALMVAFVLIGLAYVTAVRIAATGEAKAGRLNWLDRSLTAAIVVGAFVIVSLQSVGFMVDVFILMTSLAAFHLASFVGLSRCTECNRRPWASIKLRTRCPCGAERLPYLRRCVATSSQSSERTSPVIARRSST